MYDPYHQVTAPLRTLSNGDIAGAIYQHPTTSVSSFPGFDFVLTAETTAVSVTSNVTLSNLLEIKYNTLTIGSGKTITVANDGQLKVLEQGLLTGGKVIVQNGGTFTVDGDNNVTKLDLVDVEVEVQSGGIFTIENGADVDLSDMEINGIMTVENGGEVRRSDIDVNSGGKLITNSGSLFRFDTGDSIFSKGLLQINGGTFEAYDSNTWLYIYLHNSGADGSYVKNATIEDTNYGIHTNNADNLTIDNVTVTGATVDGLKLVSSQNITVKNSTFEDGGLDGLYVDASSVVILDSRFEGNAAKGVAVRGNSTADFGLPGDDRPSVIKDNDRGIHVYGSSYTILGNRTILCCTDYFSESSVYNNTDYNAKTGTGTLIAEETWWGSDPPDLSKFEEDGTLIYADWLTSPVVTRIASTPDGGELDSVSFVEDGLSLRFAEGAISTGRIAVSPNVDTKALTRPEMVRHLRRLLSQNKASATALLNQTRRDNASPHQQLAALFYLQQQAGEGNVVAANALGAKLLGTDLAAYDREFVLKQLYYVNLDAGAYKEATRLLSELTALRAEDAQNGLLALVYETETGQAPVLQQSKAAQAASSADDDDIGLNNYPNPFNPQTTIRYTLAEDGPVRLSVYDMLGREVAILVVQNAGPYVVDFDAEHLPSGRYVYRLEAGDRQRSETMLLLK